MYNKHIDFSFFIFCPTQDPDNVIFVMDATIGQACEAQVNMMNQPLVMFYPHSLEFFFSIYCCNLQKWFTLIFVLFTFLGKGIQRESRCCFSYCYQVRWPCKRWWCIECVSIWKLRSYLHFLYWVKGFFFSICNQIFPFVTNNTL